MSFTEEREVDGSPGKPFKAGTTDEAEGELEWDLFDNHDSFQQAAFFCFTPVDPKLFASPPAISYPTFQVFHLLKLFRKPQSFFRPSSQI
jgi:hypothetical protein